MKFTRLLVCYFCLGSSLFVIFFFIQVRLHDGSVHTGVIEDVDLESDLAIVRINKVTLYIYIYIIC